MKNNYEDIFIAELEGWYTDEEYFPKKLSFALFKEWFQKIRNANGLTEAQAAESAAIAAAMIIKRCEKIVDPEIAFNIAVYGFVEGSKTMPAPL